MKKKLKFINKIKYPFLAFIIPIIVMLFLFMVTGGLNAEELLIGDMQAQHVDMLLLFRKILTGEESMFYSIINGMGGDTYSSMAYYMLNPVNLLVLFFSETSMAEAVRLIILVDIGLCGLTMYILLNSKNNKNKIYSLMFSLCYALMAFTINNYFCTLWFSGIALAPLIILGIDKLINDKKPLLYMVCLALSIFSNFYFGYMTCIFCVIYFVYSIILKYKKEDRKEIFNSCIRFAVASVLAGLSVAVIFVPAILSVLGSDRTVVTESNDANLMGLIYRMFVGAYSMDDFLSYEHPCIYCGMIVLPLLVAYLLNKKITEKEKVATFSVILLFIFSILFYQISYVWHGFSYPIGYNFRFSFLLCLFVLMISHKQLCNMGKVKSTKVYKYMIAGLCILATIFVFEKFTKLSGFVSIILIAIYSILIFSNKKYMKYVLLGIVVFELIFNGYKSFYVNEDHYTTRKTLENDICLNIPNSDGYRVGGYEYYGTNENVACGFSSLDLFSTTINSNITSFFSKVGLIGGINMYVDNLGNTPVVYSLLGVKYFYSNKTLNDYKLLKDYEVYKFNSSRNEQIIETNYIYENPYVLNYGFMVKYNDYSYNPELGVFSYQNDIIRKFTGTDKDVLIGMSEENDDRIYDSKYIYLYFYERPHVFYINGKEYHDYPEQQIVAIENNFETNKFDIQVYREDGAEIGFEAYYLDLSQYMNAMNILRNNQLEEIVVNKNKITASINVKEDGLLALSIPYDENFTMYVDGVETDYTSLYDFFTAVPLSAGYHTIELVYFPKTLKAGIVISIVAILGSCVFLFDKKHKILNSIISYKFDEEK